MHLNKKIKMLREINHWSQEEMANKMNMSVSGYAKIERGESNINLHKLKKFADIFDINLSELIDVQPQDSIKELYKNTTPPLRTFPF